MIFTIVVRRWTRRRREHLVATPTPALDPAMRERIRREMELEGDR